MIGGSGGNITKLDTPIHLLHIQFLIQSMSVPLTCMLSQAERNKAGCLLILLLFILALPIVVSQYMFNI